MYKILFLIILMMIVLSGIWFGVWYSIKQSPPKEPEMINVCFNGNCFNLEKASTPYEIKTGLSFREELDSDKGMIFIFENLGKHPFWMKHALIPLDIVWLNEQKEVVSISKNNQPCSSAKCSIIEPDKDAKYVLEFLAGTVDNISLNIGDKVDF
jgi:hypothetical protein